MGRKLKTDAIPSSLLRHLGSTREYLDESIELCKKLVSIQGKDLSKLTDEEKAIVKRSSELVVLIETTMKIEGLK